MKFPRTRAGWERAFDGMESFGLASLLFVLPLSEAAKSIALAIAAAGFVGRLAVGGRYRGTATGALAALLLYVLAAGVSIASARAPMRHPVELLTLGMAAVLFPVTADACSRTTRKSLFALAIVAGAATAALAGYVEYMAGDSLRLALPSVENPVPAGEYLSAAASLGLSFLAVEFAASLAGPLAAFALGVVWLGLFMTKSRGPLLGGGAGSVVAAALAGGRRLAAAVVGVAALGAIVFVMGNPGARVAQAGGSRAALSRAATWKSTVDLVAERPLTGHGLGSYPDLDVIYEDSVGRIHQLSAHNVLLQAACDTGLLGCGTLVAFVVLGIRDAVATLRRSTSRRSRAVAAGALGAVAALLVSGVFSVSTDAEPGMLLFALLALGGAPGPGDV